jgi:hypothetical protein
MNRDDFINMIEDRFLINRQMIGEVYELIDIFPYFQSAHMLLLKGLQTSADVKFENQLRNSAIHIADREVLYYLLNTKLYDRVAKDEVRLEEVPSEVKEFYNQQTVIESAKNSEQMISEIEKNSGVSQMEQMNITTPPHSHSILISSEAETPDSEGVMLLMDEDPATDEDKVFYMDPGFSVPDYSDLLEFDTDTGGDLITEEIVGSQELSGPDQTSDKKLSQAELIDKFILANPRIEPVKNASNTPSEDISKPFTESKAEFVSEILAKIYMNQGYYSKAIDIYDKLSLKFPEKSSYFASQIELVKAHLKK